MKKLDATLAYLSTESIAGFANRIVFTTSMIYRVKDVGLDPLQLVLVGTTLEATAFLFEIPTGVVADVYSRRLSTIIGTFLIGIGFMVEGIRPLFILTLLSQVIWGLGWTFISGALDAWIADEVGVDKVGQVYLRGKQYGLIGRLAGIPFSVLLANRSLQLPFLVGGGILLLLSLFLIRFMPETGFKRRPIEERQTWRAMLTTTRQGASVIRTHPSLLNYVTIALVVGLYSEGYDRLGTAHLLENFHFPSLGSLTLTEVDWFGVLSTFTILLSLGANEIAKRRLHAASSHQLARGLQRLYAGMVICMAGLALTGNFFMALIAMLVFNTLRDVTFPLTSTWLNLFIDSEVRATVLSMTNQLDAFGQLAGGPFIGAIGAFRSIRAAILTASIVLLPSVPLYGRTLKHPMVQVNEKTD